MENKNEVWAKINGYEDYEVSSCGRVRSNKCWHGNGQVMMNIVKNNRPYSTINLCKNSHAKKFLVHRLVASAFLDNPLKLPQVNHKNCNKKDNRIENLEWVTALDNNKHAVKAGLWDFRAGKCKLAKMTWDKVREIRRIYRKGSTSYRKLGKEFGLSFFGIRQIVLNHTWK